MGEAEPRDPELVERAQRAATRLELAWERWRALHGLAGSPAQPVVVGLRGLCAQGAMGPAPGRDRVQRRRGRKARGVP